MTAGAILIGDERSVLEALHVDLAYLSRVEVRVQDGTARDGLAVHPGALRSAARCGRQLHLHLHVLVLVLVAHLRRELREQRLGLRLAHTEDRRRGLPAADAGAAHLVQREWVRTRAAARGARDAARVRVRLVRLARRRARVRRREVYAAHRVRRRLLLLLAHEARCECNIKTTDNEARVHFTPQ